MKYYRSNGEYHDYFTGYTTVPGELITKRERNTHFRYLSDNCFTLVEVSKRDTYFSIWSAFCIL
ncbi:MAG: hypothetical protein J6P99_03710 [Paludibacteraceae bacterium]|nr:hypothetical protein [Paludibacteraceae bacterium]